MIQNAGAQLFSADGQVGSSGTPAVRIFTLHFITTGVTAAIVSLRNGTSSGATAYATETGTASTGKTISYGDQGLLFPAGCFVDVDANTTSALVTFSYV